MSDSIVFLAVLLDFVSRCFPFFNSPKFGDVLIQNWGRFKSAIIITPFGGLSLFFKMLERCRFDEVLDGCEIPQQGSNRGYDPKQLIKGLFAGVWCGASRYAHLDLVRYDGALCKIIGWARGALDQFDLPYRM